MIDKIFTTHSSQSTTYVIRALPKNKRGDKLISVYWFIILTIIAGGIVLMANAFYSTPYDVRNAEAKILSEKVADCIYFGGIMNKDLIASTGAFKKEFDDNFYDDSDE